MKKSLLTCQFLCELSIVAIISLLIGAGIGAISSVSISNHLLQNEINASREEQNNINEHFGGKEMKMKQENINGITSVQAFDSIDAVVDWKVLGQLLAIGIFLTLISSTASMISIQKFSPLTILKERS